MSDFDTITIPLWSEYRVWISGEADTTTTGERRRTRKLTLNQYRTSDEKARFLKAFESRHMRDRIIDEKTALKEIKTFSMFPEITLENKEGQEASIVFTDEKRTGAASE